MRGITGSGNVSETIQIREENKRLRSQLAQLTEEHARLKAEQDEIRRDAWHMAMEHVGQNTYPHMCCDGHEQIGWSGDDESCPLCRLKADIEARERRALVFGAKHVEVEGGGMMHSDYYVSRKLNGAFISDDELFTAFQQQQQEKQA